MVTPAPPVVRTAPPGVMLAVLLTGQLMASIDGSVVSVSAPTIRADLQAGPAQIQLVVSAYLLVTGVLFVTCARLGDLIGHRRAFLVGVGWFTVGSLLCGTAVSPTVLVISRIVQAVGSALLMPQVFAMIHRQWSGAARRRAIGAYSAVLALGVVLGQLIGGLVAGGDLLGLSWRPVFLINVPIGVVVVVSGRWVLAKTATPDRPRLDVVGVVLLTAAMSAITVPLTVGAQQGWPGWTWPVLGGGLILLVGFGRHEQTADSPILDFAALRPPQVRLGIIACCIVMGCYTVLVLTLTVHLQSRLGFSPLRAGVTFAPYAIGFGILSLTWNAYPQRLQRALPVIGPAAYAIAVLLVVILEPDHWQASASIGLLLVAGAGHAAGYSPLIARITERIEPRLASAISAVNATGPTLAEVVGVAGLGSLYFAAPDSGRGLLRVAVATAVLLAVATVCAAFAISRDSRDR